MDGVVCEEHVDLETGVHVVRLVGRPAGRAAQSGRQTDWVVCDEHVDLETGVRWVDGAPVDPRRAAPAVARANAVWAGAGRAAKGEGGAEAEVVVVVGAVADVRAAGADADADAQPPLLLPPPPAEAHVMSDLDIVEHQLYFNMRATARAMREQEERAERGVLAVLCDAEGGDCALVQWWMDWWDTDPRCAVRCSCDDDRGADEARAGASCEAWWNAEPRSPCWWAVLSVGWWVGLCVLVALAIVWMPCAWVLRGVWVWGLRPAGACAGGWARRACAAWTPAFAVVEAPANAVVPVPLRTPGAPS